MRIISWNCNGAFKNKINSILSLNGDIYVIQKAEDQNKNSYLLDKLTSIINSMIILTLPIRFSHSPLIRSPHSF